MKGSQPESRVDLGPATVDLGLELAGLLFGEG
jgi:hypothetical protein